MSDNYTFQLDQFEGPLDLLLFLIRKNEVNIYDIPITKIIEQYLEFLKYATSIDLENITEFYLLASTLLYIKSRMLLPVEVDFSDEIEDPREELVAKLIDYQKFKKLTELMSEKEKTTEWVIERKKNQRVLPFAPEEDMWQEVEAWELLQSFSKIMGNLTNETIVNLYEEVSVNEKITLIQELLEEKGEFPFTDILINPESIMEVVCAFLAILESVKMKLIMVFQNRLFGDIMIRRIKEKEENNNHDPEQGAINN
ncbi:MAG: segregation/condensation protein A [Spirochaetaceae bacterium 4572_59]|nr:MAG: segregation/condensation protein A [Spirochaetaceae bacterium 4572_59]